MVASDTGTLAREASSYSASAVRWRSPLPNRIQPSAMRWRVGRRPTLRSIAFTSCQGQPVSEVRSAAGAAGALARGSSVVRIWVIFRPMKDYKARITIEDRHATDLILPAAAIPFHLQRIEPRG